MGIIRAPLIDPLSLKVIFLSGGSIESGRSWVKVDGPSESGRSFDEKWTVPG